MRSMGKKRRHGRPAVMTMCRNLLARVNYSRKSGNTCRKPSIDCCSDESAWHSADLRAHSTTVDPKCDILFVPDGFLGAGEAMRRREFIAFGGSTVAAWPFTARAQQSERMRRIGVLMNRAADDPDGQARLAAF